MMPGQYGGSNRGIAAGNVPGAMQGRRRQQGQVPAQGPGTTPVQPMPQQQQSAGINPIDTMKLQADTMRNQNPSLGNDAIQDSGHSMSNAGNWTPEQQAAAMPPVMPGIPQESMEAPQRSGSTGFQSPTGSTGSTRLREELAAAEAANALLPRREDFEFSDDPYTAKRQELDNNFQTDAPWVSNSTLNNIDGIDIGSIMAGIPGTPEYEAAQQREQARLLEKGESKEERRARRTR
jgi:hypothetical protein